MNKMKDLCTAPAGRFEVLQGNIAFAAGMVRAGIPGADGYPGTPSSEVIDRGLSQVQDMITVGWSVNEAVASAVGLGHTLAGDDCVVTMKIPGLFQAADVFSSSAIYTKPRGALVYYVAADFTPSSTQHTIDPRYFLKSCLVPVFEPPGPPGTARIRRHRRRARAQVQHPGGHPAQRGAVPQRGPGKAHGSQKARGRWKCQRA